MDISKRALLSGILVVAIVLAAFLSFQGTGFFGLGESQPGVIKIGVIAPLSGDAAAVGEGIRNSAMLAMKDLNDLKGLKNKYELVFEDDQVDPKLSVTAFNKLASIDGASAVITAASGPSNAVAPLAERKKILMISLASDPHIVEGKTVVFKHWVTPEKEAQRYVSEAQKHGLKRIALVFVNNDFGLTLKNALAAKAPKSLFVSIDSAGADEKDFRTVISKIIEKKPDALCLVTYPGQTVPLIKQAKELGFEGKITAVESFYNDGEARADKDNLLEGQWEIGSEANAEFNSEYRKAFGAEPLMASGNAFDSVRLIIFSFENASKAKAPAQAMSEIKNFQGAMGLLNVDENNIIQSEAVVHEKINGAWVTK